MQLRFDPEADALYIRLRDLPVAFTKDLGEDRYVDYAADLAPIGIELLNVSLGVNFADLPEREAIARALAEEAAVAHRLAEQASGLPLPAGPYDGSGAAR